MGFQTVKGTIVNISSSSESQDVQDYALFFKGYGCHHKSFIRIQWNKLTEGPRPFLRHLLPLRLLWSMSSTAATVSWASTVTIFPELFLIAKIPRIILNSHVFLKFLVFLMNNWFWRTFPIRNVEPWCSSTTAQFHSTKPELRFCADSNPSRGVSEICSNEDLWQWLQLRIKLNNHHHHHHHHHYHHH